MRGAFLVFSAMAIVACSSGDDASGSGGAKAAASISASSSASSGGSGGSGGQAPIACKTSGSFHVAAMSSVGRYAPGFAVLPDGKALIAGGWDAAKHGQSGAITFDPATDMIADDGKLSL